MPNVRADSGVTGELCDSAILDSCTVGLLAAGAEVGSDKVVVVFMGFVDEEVEVGC